MAVTVVLMLVLFIFRVLLFHSERFPHLMHRFLERKTLRSASQRTAENQARSRCTAVRLGLLVAMSA
jgi:predicted PurR-regulated permease PerM